MTITLVLVIAICIISYMAFNNFDLMKQMYFWPYRMVRYNEWHRLVSSAFIHADYMHLAFNMLALYSLGSAVEYYFKLIFQDLGGVYYALLFFISAAVADLPNLIMHKDNFGHLSLGASGAVAAIIFAGILINPMGQISFFFIPMPGIVFGVLYIALSTYLAYRGGDNIGHLTHFTGAVFGFIAPALLKPQLLPDFVERIKIGLL